MHGVDTAQLCEVGAGEMEARYHNTQTLIIIQFVCIPMVVADQHPDQWPRCETFNSIQQLSRATSSQACFTAAITWARHRRCTTQAQKLRAWCGYTLSKL